MEDKILDLIVEQQEITWKSLLLDLVRQTGMDPWDVDVSVLSKKYMSKLKKYKDMDLKISGKILLAAAMLLKMKAQQLVGDDLNEFDRLLAQTDTNEDDFYSDLEAEFRNPSQIPQDEIKKLIPRTPQPRKRKVSVYDLVRALEKALEVKHRRLVKKGMREYRVFIPRNPEDVTLSIKRIQKRVKEHYLLSKNKLRFSQLVNSDEKLDKVFTFIPLLHLSNHRVVDLNQEEAFDDFSIHLAKVDPIITNQEE